MSIRRRTSVGGLAREAGLDIDEVLVTLWDEGFDDLLGPSDLLQKGDVNRARRVLGVATRRELKSSEYWRTLFEIDAIALDQLLEELGLTPLKSGPGLPKKALSRLKAEARRRGLDPVTGSKLAIPSVPGGDSRRRVGEAFTLECHGHERAMSYLSPDQVTGIHYALVDDFAGSPDPINPAGVRSQALLESACFRPQTSLGDVGKYTSIESAAAALLHGIVLDHPFHNGNKRTGLVAALVFLDENGLFPEFDQDELFKMVLQVAQHRITPFSVDQMSDREVFAITVWFCDRTRLVERGERPLAWRKLKRILTAHGCAFEHPRVGNRLNVARTITRRGLFGRSRTERLRTQVAYTDDGRDADVSVIKKIRTDLKLDDESGMDSQLFYSGGHTEPADFIAQYRKTLGRLAKL